MKEQFKTGMSFGMTSGVITTLGLIVGLHSGTHSRLAVIGGIMTIAIADAFSDALGIHISEESENKHTEKEIWMATIFTFFAKFIFASIFIIPIFLFPLFKAIIASIIMGLSVLTIFSCYLAKKQQENYFKVIFEHLSIAILVIILTHKVGEWLAAIIT